MPPGFAAIVAAMRGNIPALVLLLAAVAASAQGRLKPDAELRAEALREPSHARFWNRPGATLDDYLFDWVDCYRVVRGYRPMGGEREVAASPRGTGVKPPDLMLDQTLIHPDMDMSMGGAVAMGALAGIGEAIAADMFRTDLLRSNRSACLMARGWRQHRPDAATARQLRDAGAAGREELVAGLVGAANPPSVAEPPAFRNFAVPPEDAE